MAVIRDRPYVNSNFLVDFGDGDARSATAGFAEVIFPEFTIDRDGQPRGGPGKSPIADSTGATAGNRLVLRRGLIARWTCTVGGTALAMERRRSGAPSRSNS